MKTLILNGSPRRNGNTAFMISELKKHLDGEVKVVDAYFADINACIDCRYCWKHNGCAQKDGMQEVYDYIQECDNIIIASSVNFSELTGKLLSFASRLQTYWAARFYRQEEPIAKPKHGGIILVGGGDGSHKKAEGTAKTLLKMMNTTYDGSAFSLQTNDIPSKEDKNALNDLKILAEKLNALYTTHKNEVNT